MGVSGSPGASPANSSVAVTVAISPNAMSQTGTPAGVSVAPDPSNLSQSEGSASASGWAVHGSN
jgi:hypothetical protein